MKINNQLRWRKIKRKEWPDNEWIKVMYVGSDVAVVIDQSKKESVMFYDKNDEDWLLVNPYIPLMPLQEKDEDIE